MSVISCLSVTSTKCVIFPYDGACPPLCRRLEVLAELAIPTRRTHKPPRMPAPWKGIPGAEGQQQIPCSHQKRLKWRSRPIMSERTTRMRSASSNSASRCSRSSSVGSCASIGAGATGTAALLAAEPPLPAPSVFTSAAPCAAKEHLSGHDNAWEHLQPSEPIMICCLQPSSAGPALLALMHLAQPPCSCLTLQSSTPCVCS